jgi:hypothetical protein
MHRFVRRPAFALVVACGVAAAAYAASHSGGPVRSARLANPRFPTVSLADPMPLEDSQARRAGFGSAHPDGAFCELIGCEDERADAAEFSTRLDPSLLLLSDLDRPDLDGSAPTLAAMSLGAFGPELKGDPNPIYLASIEPSAVSAPTPEISTAAMLALGFAGVVWTARRMGHAASKPKPQPRPC